MAVIAKITHIRTRYCWFYSDYRFILKNKTNTKVQLLLNEEEKPKSFHTRISKEVSMRYRVKKYKKIYIFLSFFINSVPLTKHLNKTRSCFPALF